MYVYRLVFATLLLISVLAAILGFANEMVAGVAAALSCAVANLFAVAMCDGIDQIVQAIRDVDIHIASVPQE